MQGQQNKAYLNQLKIWHTVCNTEKRANFFLMSKDNLFENDFKLIAGEYTQSSPTLQWITTTC